MSTPSHQDSASYVNDPKSTLCRHWNHWMLLRATFRLPIFTMLACHVTWLAVCMQWIADDCNGSSQAMWTFFSRAQEGSRIPYSICKNLPSYQFSCWVSWTTSTKKGGGGQKESVFFCVNLHMHQNRNPQDQIEPVTGLQNAVRTSCRISQRPRLHELQGLARNVQCMCTVFLSFSGPISL